MMKTLPRDKQLAWHVLGAVLRTVRDRVPVNLAAHLGAQLPLLVRGAYYDQWRPSETPHRWRSVEDFAGSVSRELSTERPVDVIEAACAVFRVLDHHVEPNQIAKVRQALPEGVRDLWPPDGRAQPAAGHKGRGIYSDDKATARSP